MQQTTPDTTTTRKLHPMVYQKAKYCTPFVPKTSERENKVGPSKFREKLVYALSDDKQVSNVGLDDKLIDKQLYSRDLKLNRREDIVKSSSTMKQSSPTRKIKKPHTQRRQEKDEFYYQSFHHQDAK
jgi:hypothetical protein